MSDHVMSWISGHLSGFSFPSILYPSILILQQKCHCFCRHVNLSPSQMKSTAPSYSYIVWLGPKQNHVKLYRALHPSDFWCSRQVFNFSLPHKWLYILITIICSQGIHNSLSRALKVSCSGFFVLRLNFVDPNVGWCFAKVCQPQKCPIKPV